MSQQQNTPIADDTLEPVPNYALDVLLFIVKTVLIAAGVFGLAWILVNVKFNS